MKNLIVFLVLMLFNLAYATDYDFDAMFSESNSKNTNNNMINVTGFMEQAKKEQKKIREEEIARERVLKSSRDPLRDKCAILVDDFVAYSACIGDEESVFGYNLKAYYAIRRECSSLAGIDDRGLSYLCQNPNPNACVGLKASQDTINACYQCGGSNLWLRVYAAGKVLKCY